MPVTFGSMEIGNGETTTTSIAMGIGKNLEKDVPIRKGIGTMATKDIIGIKENGTKNTGIGQEKKGFHQDSFFGPNLKTCWVLLVIYELSSCIRKCLLL
jgi:hypothetical protein